MIRTVAVFRSQAFNTTEERDYFVNPGCFGDDVARWLGERLRAAGVSASEPGQEDWGWYIHFSVDGTSHIAGIGLRPGDDTASAEWLVFLQRRGGWRGLLLGGAHKAVTPAAAIAVHRVLAGHPHITDLQWHDDADFHGGNESRGAPEPL